MYSHHANLDEKPTGVGPTTAIEDGSGSTPEFATKDIMAHICIIFLTHKQARARKVPYGSRCGDPATEFFQANVRGGKPIKYCRCAEHAVAVDKDIVRKGSFYQRITQEEYETEQL